LSATHCLTEPANAGVTVVPQPTPPAASHQVRLQHLAAATRANPAVVPLQFCAAVTPLKVKLSILMAAYNEEQTITQVVQAVLGVDYPCEMELIVVNDGSKDQTGRLLEEIGDPRVVVHHHPVNRGKGAAVKTAVTLASGTHIVPFDADLEYLPEDLPRLLEPIIRGRCNVVYGTRMFGVNTVHRSFRYAVGNRFMSRLANLLFDSCISDLHTCLKLIPLEMVRALTLTEDGFGLDTEITASLLRHGARPFEVPISYYSRSHAQGKKISWRDAVECIVILLRVRMRSVPDQPECFTAASLRPNQAPAFSYRSAPRPVRQNAAPWALDPAARQPFAEAGSRVEAVSQA
jgi:Glycosyl transferase family 2